MYLNPTFAALVASGAILVTPELGWAQTPPAPPPVSPPVVKEGDPNKSLSEKLSETEGVLTPRSDADKQMQIKPPASTGSMPILPPPG
jgi:hypothetical protein